MWNLGTITLGLIALFCGGCSVLALAEGGINRDVVLVMPGFIIAGLCIWGIVRINRSDGGAE